MNELLPIIRRQRRPLVQADAPPDAEPVQPVLPPKEREVEPVEKPRPDDEAEAKD